LNLFKKTLNRNNIDDNFNNIDIWINHDPNKSKRNLSLLFYLKDHLVETIVRALLLDKIFYGSNSYLIDR